MEVFISYSFKDKKFVDKLSKRLEESSVSVIRSDKSIKVGDPILSIIKEAISKSDYIIVVLSNESVHSSWVNHEIASVLMNEKSKGETLLMPVLIENCEVPFNLSDRLFADFRKSFDDGFIALLDGLQKNNKEIFSHNESIESKSSLQGYSVHIEKLKEAYNSGNLTIFCGAGVSFDAGIPTWDKLLKELLKEVYSDHKLPDIDAKLADLFQKQQNLSALIVAQYLKMGLGKDFIRTVRSVLYADYKGASNSIQELVELCRPKRNRKALKAIVTFNFDDIIEETLLKEKIACKSIYDEGERFSESQIPIFHPHGYLPRTKKLTKKHKIVFSEDAYHSQFMDPFSWSNLVQLNYLNTSTCLFVGISLTDPNMRRLLDVSERKNKKELKNHYIIKKRYKLKDLFEDKKMLSKKNEALIPIIENIEEQDASHLGFNMIWVNSYSDIPEIIKKIGE